MSNNTTPAPKVRRVDAGHDKDLLVDTVRWLLNRRSKTVRASDIQRGIRVGFAKAGRLLNLLDDAGIVELGARSVYTVRFDKDATAGVLAALATAATAAEEVLEDVELQMTTHRGDGVHSLKLGAATVPVEPGQDRERALVRLLWSTAADREARYTFRTGDRLAQLDLGLLLDALVMNSCVCTESARCSVHAHVLDNLDTVRLLLRAAMRPTAADGPAGALIVDQAVRQVHYPVSMGGTRYCEGCCRLADVWTVEWECPTIRAVNETLAALSDEEKTPR
ncbi:hypothetical protein [Actinomadura sp. 3N407]|uniref:hypothetical protein n=1 Tax=Actinomadura sp. 3N407 TaxID=3457423 RepID=UPI003FCE8F6B